MKTSPVRSLLHSRYRKLKQKGFSLTEILISTSLATSLLGLLLFFMVDVLKTNQVEKARSDLNEEMKRAIEYIANELREANYVYDGMQLVDRDDSLPNFQGLKYYLPDFGTNSKIILAFWKVEQVPYDTTSSLPTNCDTSFANNPIKLSECKNLNIERRTYTLVVYLQTTNPSKTWPGESRIERFQLRKYSTLNTLERTPGYIDPVSESAFGLWPLKTGQRPSYSVEPTRPPINRETLVDFVARPSAPLEAGLVCSSDNIDVDNDGESEYTRNYARSPYDNPSISTDDANSFFACVNNADGSVRYNQDVVLSLKGNAKGKPGIDEDSFLDMLQLRAINRGIVGKTVSD